MHPRQKFRKADQYFKYFSLSSKKLQLFQKGNDYFFHFKLFCNIVFNPNTYIMKLLMRYGYKIP